MDPTFSHSLAWLVAIISGLTTIIVSLRRRPPLAEEIYKDFVRRPEMEAVESRFMRMVVELRTDTNAISSKISDELALLRGSTDRNFRDLERAIGRIEGSVKQHLDGGKASP